MTRNFTIAALLSFACLPSMAQDVVATDLYEAPPVVYSLDLRDFVHSNASSSSQTKIRRYIEGENPVVSFEDRITNLPDYLHIFIKKYREATQEVLNGGTNWLSDPTKGEKNGNIYYFPLKEISCSASFTYEIGATSNEIKQAAIDATEAIIKPETDSLSSFMPYAFLSVNFDCPEAFWIGNSIQYGKTGTQYSWTYDNGEGTVTFKTALMFILHTSNFDVRINGGVGYDFTSPTNIASSVNRFHSQIQTILEQSQSNSWYWRLLKAHDWLTTHNSYNRPFYRGMGPDMIGELPWSPLSALEGKTDSQAPVCEGYARALKVLCDEMGIPCILMTGYAWAKPEDTTPADHMWNYVQMEDGNWYSVDPTWDDPFDGKTTKAISGDETHKWFLVGSNTELATDWTYDDSHFENWRNSYPNKGPWGWNIVQGPVISTQSYPGPYDPSKDGITDWEDIQLMAEKIVNDNNDLLDIDDNGRVSIGDLVRLINYYLSHPQ